MAHEEEPSDIPYDTMEEFFDEHRARDVDEQLAQEWDEADPEEHLPTIPGTAVLDIVEGNIWLWDAECNRGLQYDGELMARKDAEMLEPKA